MKQEVLRVVEIKSMYFVSTVVTKISNSHTFCIKQKKNYWMKKMKFKTRMLPKFVWWFSAVLLGQ